MKAVNGRFLDGAVHPFNLPVGPRMEGTCQAMFDAMPMADHIKPMWLVGFSSSTFSELRSVVF